LSIFSRFFKTSRKAIEKALEDIYTQQISTITGQSLADARVEIRNAINMCKQQAKMEGTDCLPANLGDAMLKAAVSSVAFTLEIVEKARKEGARDEDIREWWNLDDLQRRMVLWSETVFRNANFLSFKEQGLSPDDAMLRVRTMLPMYGQPEDESQCTGDDRPLPHELRGRVDIYREKHGETSIMERVKEYSSYNAFVRYELRNGRL
jgi:hypothetical protein